MSDNSNESVLKSAVEKARDFTGEVEQAITTVTLSGHYEWTAGMTPDEIKALAFDEAVKKRWLAARRAGQDGHPMLTAYREPARLVRELFHQAWLNHVVPVVTWQELMDCESLLKSLHDSGRHVPEGMPVLEAREPGGTVQGMEVIAEILGLDNAVQQKLGRALKLGFELDRTVGASILFPHSLIWYAPVVDPADAFLYLQEGSKALAAFRYKTLWHAFAKRRTTVDLSKVDLYNWVTTQLT